LADQAKRTGNVKDYSSDASKLLDKFATSKKSFITAQYLASRRHYERTNSPGLHEATVNEAALQEFEDCWKEQSLRLEVIPGKEALSAINNHLQDQYGVSVTPTAIIDAMQVDEIPDNMKQLIHDLYQFASS